MGMLVNRLEFSWDETEDIFVTQAMDERGRGIDYEKPLPASHSCLVPPLVPFGMKDLVFRGGSLPEGLLKDFGGVALDLIRRITPPEDLLGRGLCG